MALSGSGTQHIALDGISLGRRPLPVAGHGDVEAPGGNYAIAAVDPYAERCS